MQFGYESGLGASTLLQTAGTTNGSIFLLAKRETDQTVVVTYLAKPEIKMYSG